MDAMNDELVETPFGLEPPDETDRTLDYYIENLGEERLREYDPSWSDEQVMEWDGNFRSDGALMLVCCERDIEVPDYRKAIEAAIRKLDG